VSLTIIEVDRISKIVDFLKLNGIFLEEIPDYKVFRKFKVESILNDDFILKVYENNAFNLIFWNKFIEIESKLSEDREFFKYKGRYKILVYSKEIILKNGFYNDEYLNNKLIAENLDFTLSNKVREIVNFFKNYGIIIEKLIKNRNDMFTMLISLGYVQLIIKCNSVDNYYLTVQSNSKIAINSIKLKQILNKLYGKGEENFWIEPSPFYNKISTIIDIYINDKKNKELV